MAQVLDLFQAMRDVEHRTTFAGEAVERHEQLIGFLRRQHGGRLVHDQQARFLQQAAHDLDALAFTDRQVGDQRCRIERQAVVDRNRPDLFATRHRCRSRTGQRQRDVLSHAQRLKQREVLKHHADAKIAGGGRIGHDGHRSCPSSAVRHRSAAASRRSFSPASTCRLRSRPTGRGSRQAPPSTSTPRIGSQIEPNILVMFTCLQTAIPVLSAIADFIPLPMAQPYRPVPHCDLLRQNLHRFLAVFHKFIDLQKLGGNTGSDGRRGFRGNAIDTDRANQLTTSLLIQRSGLAQSADETGPLGLRSDHADIGKAVCARAASTIS